MNFFILFQAFKTLKQVGSGSNAYLNQQSYNSHSFGNDSSREKPYYGIPSDKSWKYSSPITDVLATVPQRNNYFDTTNIQAHPLDNENVIPTTSNYFPQKGSGSMFAPFEKDPFVFDNNNLGKLDFDLTALLAATPFPKQEDSNNYSIPTQQPLGFNLYGNAVPTEENMTDHSTEIWRERILKDSITDVFQNADIKQEDPFVNELPMEPRLYSISSTDSLLTCTTEQGSPLSATMGASPMNQGTPWEENDFEQLLDGSLDLSGVDFFLPPPPKRIHDSPEPVLMSPHYPSSPETIYEAPSPLTMEDDDYVKPKPKRTLSTDAPKQKSTILFGKHEDEIIHKLLVPNLSSSKKPITRNKLVSMPVEEFNHLLERTKLNDIEVAFMKEWRRRGKNKTAAQVARKRKREEVGDLESEVEAMRHQKAELQSRHNQLRSQIKSLKERSLAAEKRVYKKHNHSSGQSVSRNTHLIHVAHGNKLFLVPKVNSQIISVN